MNKSDGEILRERVLILTLKAIRKNRLMPNYDFIHKETFGLVVKDAPKIMFPKWG